MGRDQRFKCCQKVGQQFPAPPSGSADSSYDVADPPGPGKPASENTALRRPWPGSARSSVAAPWRRPGPAAPFAVQAARSTAGCRPDPGSAPGRAPSRRRIRARRPAARRSRASTNSARTPRKSWRRAAAEPCNTHWVRRLGGASQVNTNLRTGASVYARATGCTKFFGTFHALELRREQNFALIPILARSKYKYRSSLRVKTETKTTIANNIRAVIYKATIRPRFGSPTKWVGG